VLKPFWLFLLSFALKPQPAEGQAVARDCVLQRLHAAELEQPRAHPAAPQLPGDPASTPPGNSQGPVSHRSCGAEAGRYLLALRWGTGV